LNFWGTWCKPCREEMPDMNRIYNEGHEDYEIIAVNVSEDEQQINQFLSSLDEKLNFPVALDRNREVTKAYQVGPLPTTIASNKNGIVVDKKEYQLTVDDIYRFVEQSSSERSEEHTSELQSRFDLVCRLLLEKKKNNKD